MAEAPFTDLAGHSGKRYRYWIYPLGTTLDQGPGNFCFAKEGPGGNRRPIFFGQAENLARYRMPFKTENCIDANGATHIMAHKAPGPRQERLDEEADLKRLRDTHLQSGLTQERSHD